ncbi:hypothetical protein U1Q18_051764, partial [Sarracenia purpurea var. burkii]
MQRESAAMELQLQCTPWLRTVRILYVNVASRTRGILVFLSWKSRMYERPALLIKPAPKPPS